MHSVAVRAEALLPGRGAALSQLWRTKQLEYTWLQSLMGVPPREDFAAVTAHALDYALAALGTKIANADRDHLLDAYLVLAPYRGCSGGPGLTRTATALDPVERDAGDAGAARPA